jgi:peroxiredoxin (alkyl hydroperoxide reductase subunit C)|tara:strand:- start:9240 stop:9845 length:606 start_codon:yes stop_codon:yes gene_type:complete
MVAFVSQTAPDFTATAVMPDGSIDENFNLSESTKDQYKVLFFYPLDFTFVCPSELVALDKRMDAFKEKNTQVIALSIDSEHTHCAWRRTPLNEGGIGPVKYTMVSDKKHEICRAYGIEHPQKGVALRGAFVMDKEMTIRSAIINDLPIGRNIDEILRVIDAIQFHEAHGQVCPAGWQTGQSGMVADHSGVKKFLSQNEEAL